MTRTLLSALGLTLVILFALIAVGTFAPRGPEAGPYYSSLSNFAVDTAEACPCNQKICSGNVCIPNPDPEFPRACCVQSGTCKQAVCFP